MSETKTKERPELTFDGFGINGPDEYRTRLCTFRRDLPDVARKYGPMFEASPIMLEALKKLCADKYLADPINADRMADARAAIARAERRQS